jgi:glycosyltransferase involved in cell wall biosynthesis
VFVSNLYFPHHISGYEMLCHEAATNLQARGHQVSVLTSTYGVVGPRQDEPGVYRRLGLESDRYYYRPHQALRYWPNKHSNWVAIQQVCTEVAPEVVVIWGMWNLSRQVAASAERLAGSKVVYYLADVWPVEPSAHEAYWEGTADSLAGRMFKRFLRAPARFALRGEWRPYRLRYEHVVASCQFTRDELIKAGLPIEHGEVIYEGIDPVPYREAARQRPGNRNDGCLRVVFVGGLVPHKGAHTAIEAFGSLAEDETPLPMHLTVLGAGHPEYELYLHQLVQRWRLEDSVSFHGPIPRSELPEYLAQFDVLVMPSVYKEPLARISQEALASGLVLVATPTGGTPELLSDGQNGLAFEPEDARGLANQLKILAADPALRARLAEAGWHTVSERFTIAHMIDQLEAYLAEIAAQPKLDEDPANY